MLIGSFIQIKLLWDGLHHVDDLVGLQSSLVHNRVISPRNKSNNLFALLVSIQLWINLACFGEIIDGFIVSLEVFQDCSSVIEEIWIGFVHVSFSLCICNDSTFQFSGAFIVLEKVSEMSVAQNVPAVWVLHVKANGFLGELDALFEVFLSLLSVNAFTVARGL